MSDRREKPRKLISEYPFAGVFVDSKQVASGNGHSIKDSERAAARSALQKLGARPLTRSGIEVHVGG